jgi:hypothetical protein
LGPLRDRPQALSSGACEPRPARKTLAGYAAVRRYPVTIESLNDETVNREVDRAYATKYARQGRALRQVISPEALHHAAEIV